MLTQLKITLQPENTVQIANSWAYNMYGALVEKMPPYIAENLHAQAQTPISQYLTAKSNTCIWNVCLFGNIGKEILPILENTDSYFLTKFNQNLKVRNIESCAEFTETDFCRKYLIEDDFSRLITLNFETPCAFKSAGEYAILPSKEWIIKSLVNKWDVFSENNKIGDEFAIQNIIDCCRIVKYNLRSTVYPLKDVKIPSFTGFVTLSARGNEQLLRLFNLIACFGEFSGIGIKTALGMGGVHVSRNFKKEFCP